MKPTDEQLKDIKEKYVHDNTGDILIDKYNRPYIKIPNGKKYLSAKNKYHYTIKN